MRNSILTCLYFSIGLIQSNTLARYLFFVTGTIYLTLAVIERFGLLYQGNRNSSNLSPNYCHQNNRTANHYYRPDGPTIERWHENGQVHCREWWTSSQMS